MKQGKLRVGDLVCITKHTDDDRLPTSRIGILLRRLRTTVHYTDTRPAATPVWFIQFTNGEILQFHEMYIKKV